MPKLELHLTAAGYGSSVKVDGREVPGCKSVQLRCRAGEITTAILEVLCLDGAVVVCDDAEVITELKPPDLPPGNAT